LGFVDIIVTFNIKLYNYGEVWCSNSGETFAHFCTSVKKVTKWAYLADYFRTSFTDLDQLFSFDRHMGGYY